MYQFRVAEPPFLCKCLTKKYKDDTIITTSVFLLFNNLVNHKGGSMLLTRGKVGGYLDRFLFAEDRKHVDLITDLSWAATIILEFGFQCPKNKQAEMEKKLLELVQKLSNSMRGVERKTKALITTNSLNDEPAFPLERQPTWIDIGVVCNIFHALTVQRRIIEKEKMLAWLKEAWDAGVYQQRVYAMEVEDGAMNEYGIVTNFGAALAMFGVSKGLLPN